MVHEDNGVYVYGTYEVQIKCNRAREIMQKKGII